MSRILIRAKVSPFESNDVPTTLSQSLLGNNSGNLLFAYSVTRLLDTGDNDLTFVSDYRVMNDKVTASWVNENFDMVVLPMANSFRNSYTPHLKAWTKLIRQLTIPCIVVGIGVQMKNDENLTDNHSYDEVVKDFVNAILDHSTRIAVRGEVTAEYLRHLGFKYVEVTGCPSFALAGPEFPIKELPPLTKDSVATVTGSINSPASFQAFMRRTFKDLPNCYFVPQFNEDLALMYYGIPIKKEGAKQNGYPYRISDPVFMEDRARFFINIKSMLEFNRSCDFNYGTRIHGCISNVVCGVPSMLFAQDKRVGELANYHHLPLCPLSDVESGKSIYDFYESIDLSYMAQGHEERFRRLMSFLDENGVPHIWLNGTPDRFPADEKLANGIFHEPVRAAVAEFEAQGYVKRLAEGRKWAAKK